MGLKFEKKKIGFGLHVSLPLKKKAKFLSCHRAASPCSKWCCQYTAANGRGLDGGGLVPQRQQSVRSQLEKMSNLREPVEDQHNEGEFALHTSLTLLLI